ncbi:MAG: ABC transporter permease [Hyphomicrobiales bacterium]
MASEITSGLTAPRFAALLPRDAWPWFGVLTLALVCGLRLEAFVWLTKFPAELTIPLASWINAFTDWFVDLAEPVTRFIAKLLEFPMLILRDLLQWVPWPVTVLSIGLLAYHSSGWRLVVLCVVACLYVALSGYWEQAMNTMALVGVAVPMSLALGLAIGIFANRTDLGRRIVPPILDLMQTIPTFAYLIPLLVLFGFGPVVGLIASAVYACPPMVRNVALGLQLVPEEIREAARMSGCSPIQRLFWVEIPAAMGQIKVGINQTIMAALSMVIIASVIGGFNDIGWEVLSTMRKARFGDSLLAGVVIVFIAIIMDRISAAYASRDKARAGGGADDRRNFLIAAGILAVLCVIMKAFGLGETIESAAWTKNLADWLNVQLDAIVTAYGNTLTAIKNFFFFFYLLPLRTGLSQSILPFTWGFDFTMPMRIGYGAGCLIFAVFAGYKWSWRASVVVAVLGYLLYFGTTGMPWSVAVAGMTVIAWQAGGKNTALFVFCALAFILLTGMWDRAMLSVYLCAAAAILSFVFGASLGVWAASNDTVSAIVRPICDTFQTIPLFVFLIPMLMFFQVGEFTALLAIIAYAFVPAVRYTENGLREVSPQLLEVAVEQGCTPSQIFWQVKMPLAMPSILVGLNQTIMYAFAMLVIAALVGTTGLGQQIYLSLSAANTGEGLVSGLSMALLAMIADRILQAWAASRFACLDTT